MMIVTYLLSLLLMGLVGLQTTTAQGATTENQRKLTAPPKGRRKVELPPHISNRKSQTSQLTVEDLIAE